MRALIIMGNEYIDIRPIDNKFQPSIVSEQKAMKRKKEWQRRIDWQPASGRITGHRIWVCGCEHHNRFCFHFRVRARMTVNSAGRALYRKYKVFTVSQGQRAFVLSEKENSAKKKRAFKAGQSSESGNIYVWDGTRILSMQGCILSHDDSGAEMARQDTQKRSWRQVFISMTARD